MKKFIITLLSVAFVMFLYGIAVGHYEVFPYMILKESQIFFEKSNDVSKNKFSDFNINSIIDIKNENDIIQKRNELINFIWKQNNLPKTYANLKSTSNFSDSNYNDLSNFSHLNKYEIVMEYGINSVVYHFHAESKNGNLVIYHEGHGGDFIKGKYVINELLSEGFDVLAFSMPLHGKNNNPEIFIENIGKIHLKTHDQLSYLDNENFSSLKLFVEPILVSLNFLDEEYTYNSYSFIGLSGGGWTGILFSSIDDRISQTFSVAGSLPIFLRTESRDFGDYEQTLPQLYSKVNYLELYILDSVGEERKLVQIFNEFDPCCFSGNSFVIYENVVRDIVRSFENGDFQIILDSSHNEHKISEFALEKIIYSLHELSKHN